MSKPKGVKVRVPDADELRPNARSTSLHPGTRLSNVVAGVQMVQPFSDAKGTTVDTRRAGGSPKRQKSDGNLVPSINPAMMTRVTDATAR
jgi:hypothetical protein